MFATLILLGLTPIVLVMALAPASDLVSLVRRKPSPPTPGPSEPARLLFLVPAHNEKLLITDCVRSLLEMDHPADQMTVVVVADNCSDRTAELARDAGARCLEREDKTRRGKPHALAWALEQLTVEDWDACVIIDADSTVDRGFASALSSRSPLQEKCVQTYFDVSNEDESWLTRLAGVLARVRYERLYPLKQQAGLNSPLTGNGMCIGSAILSREGWPAFSLTENWELYARYTAQEIPIEFEVGARLYSHEASRMTQASTQRKRWLAGRTWVLRHYGGPVLRAQGVSVHQKLDVLGELASPSPVLHLIGAGAVATLALTVDGGFAGLLVAGAAVLTLVPIAVHTASVTWQHPERWHLIKAFLFLPAYAVWRLITVVGTVGTMRAGRWLKTERA